MKVKSESEVAQSCPTLSDPMDYSLPGSSVHGIFQAGVLEWGAIAFSEVYQEPISFEPRDVFGLLEKYKMALTVWSQISEESNQRSKSVQFSRPSVQLPQD